MQSKNIEHFVEEITRKVLERLQENKGTPHNDVREKHVENRVETPVVRLIRDGDINAKTTYGLDRIKKNIASIIDHTLLKPEATKEELDKLCDEAIQYSFATVCVNSSNIPYVAKRLTNSSVKPIAVVGFPLGAASSAAKAYEAREAVNAGAKEIDMVINIGALKSKDYVGVYDDIKKVVLASKPNPVKVILETSKLIDEEKIAGCLLAKMAGAHFVKTSTGFGGGGATAADIALMRKIVGHDMGVKASGGVRTIDDAIAMVKAGANRLGASNSVAIVKGEQSRSNY